MMQIYTKIKAIFTERFNILDHETDNEAIISSIHKEVEFKGVNIWALICAIFIASIGLNVNSTAVIIGAMLISPLMGPVMGIGLGLAVKDVALVKKGALNLLLATIISILTSALYFTLTPLHEAQSELLARTSPSIWDVFIAFFGGLVGMAAASRKVKSNVIPGVAIATALMPPLCTAGYGLATGNFWYVIGALYLYFINSVFIATGTYLIALYLKLFIHPDGKTAYQNRISHIFWGILVITILPSIYLGYRIVDKSIFEVNARKFVDEQFKFKNTQVISKTYKYSSSAKSIDLILLGAELNNERITLLEKRLGTYNLDGVKLQIRQGLDAKQQIDISQIKASIMEEVFRNEHIQDSIAIPTLPLANIPPNPDIAVTNELKILFPQVVSFGTSKIAVSKPNVSRPDTVMIALISVKSTLKKKQKAIIQQWLRKRYEYTSLMLVVE